MRFIVLFIACLFAFSSGAQAAPPTCNAAAEGTIVYNKDNKLVQFCNGTNWIAMSGSFSGGTDTLAGLSCTSGQVPQWSGTAWACGAGGSGLWSDSGNNYIQYTAAIGARITPITGMTAPVYTSDTLGGLSCANTQIPKWNGTAWACAADATGAGLPALTSAQIWVGNGTNVATGVALSGDATVDNAGVLTVGTNKITNAKAAQMAANTIKGNNTGATANAADLTAAQATAMLSAMVGDSGSGGAKGLVPAPATGDAAAGKYLKADGTWATPASALPGLAATNIWVGNAGGAATAVAMSGDATLSNVGALTIGTGAVNSTKIADGTVTSTDIMDGVVSSLDITDATITGADIAATTITGANIANATVTVGKLSATGTASATTYLRGDGTWAAPAGGGAAPQGTQCGMAAIDGDSVNYFGCAQYFNWGGASSWATCNGTNIATDATNCPSGYSALVYMSGMTAQAGSYASAYFRCLKTCVKN